MHASSYATLKKYNLICEFAIKLKFFPHKHNDKNLLLPNFKAIVLHKLSYTSLQWRSQKYCLGEASEYISGQGVWGAQPPSR